MNQHDSERIGEVLRGAGYHQTAEVAQADLVLLNTCSVRDKAEHKLRSEVGRLGLVKRARPELLICVAGCVAQQEGERLLDDLPQIDLVIGPDNIPELPHLLAELETGGPPRVRTEFDLAAPRFLMAGPGAAAGPCAYVTVMKGCDERCSFCVVPYTRGPERYRPAPEILQEIEQLVSSGVREVTLLGQTVNSYRDPSGALPTEITGSVEPPVAESTSEFPRLLRAIATCVPKLRRLRYTSPHPRHLTPALIAAHAELPVLPRHVHMPVQSGSNRILKRMLRRYTVEEYVRRTQALRDAVPGLTLSTDVIVGFPGETERDFEQTLALVEERNFVGVFGFKYSPRPLTPALKLRGDVPEEQKRLRLTALFERVDAQRRAHLRSVVGSTAQVLIEGRGRGESYTGRTERNEIVHVACHGDPTGELLDVRITEAYNNSLRAEPTDPSQRVRAALVTAVKQSLTRALPVI